MKKHPTAKQLKTLKKAGWRKCHKGLFWQSPYDQYYFSPQAAIVKEKAACECQSEPEPPESGVH